LRSAMRNHDSAGNRNYDLGFRLVTGPGPGPAQSSDKHSAANGAERNRSRVHSDGNLQAS